MAQLTPLDRLRRIANRAGAPVWADIEETAYMEQRMSLDWIALEAAEAIRELTASSLPEEKL